MRKYFTTHLAYTGCMVALVVAMVLCSQYLWACFNAVTYTLYLLARKINVVNMRAKISAMRNIIKSDDLILLTDNDKFIYTKRPKKAKEDVCLMYGALELVIQSDSAVDEVNEILTT